MDRGGYGQLFVNGLKPAVRKQVLNLVRAAREAQKIDEHGGWNFGARFDRHGRGYSIRWDLYAVGRDAHTRRTLVVIQVRKWQKSTRRGYPNIHKSYFLIGRNEDDTVFAHPVESRVVHTAIRRGKDVIKAVQSWIFGAPYERVIRQGDVALVPVRTPKGEKLPTRRLRLGADDGTSANHLLDASEIRLNGALFARDPLLRHEPGTHPPIHGRGWYKVVVGRRGKTYSFAAPTID